MGVGVRIEVAPRDGSVCRDCDLDWTGEVGAGGVSAGWVSGCPLWVYCVGGGDGGGTLVWALDTE